MFQACASRIKCSPASFNERQVKRLRSCSCEEAGPARDLGLNLNTNLKGLGVPAMPPTEDLEPAVAGKSSEVGKQR